MRPLRYLFLLLALGLALAPPAGANDGTQVENARLGDAGWSPNPSPEQVRWGQSAASEAIEAYASGVSVVAGQSLTFFVQTAPVAPYRVEIHRLGWYGGKGGRRMLCLPSCTGSFDGVTQPAPPAPDPATGLLNAGWRPTLDVATGASWASGYYVAEFVLTASGRSTQVPFIVRSPNPDPNAILVMAPTNTWQAYNHWGGRSLYDRGAAGGAGVKVSYLRPYARTIPALYRFEIQLVRYLEREGRSVEYTTNLDVDRDPASVRAHPLAISNGHDEYWSMRVRDAFQGARDAGTNLMFMGSNSAYWHVRHEADRQTLVAFKHHPDTEAPSPGLATARFREIGRPECALLGVQFQGGYTGDPTVNREYTVVSPALEHPWMAGTGFVAGDRLPFTVGYEWDAMVPGCTPVDAVVFFQRTATSEPETDRSLGDGLLAHAVAYRAASGATVFASGSMQFNFALDDLMGVAEPASPKAQRFVRAMLDDLGDRVVAPWPGTPSRVRTDGAAAPGAAAAPAPSPAAPGPGAGPGAPAPVAAPDRRGPGLTIGLPRTLRVREGGTVLLSVACSEACRGSARARFTGLPASSGAPRITIKRTSGAARRAAWRLSFSRAAAQRVRRALASRRVVRLSVTVTGTDPAGNRTSVTRSMALRR